MRLDMCGDLRAPSSNLITTTTFPSSKLSSWMYFGTSPHLQPPRNKRRRLATACTTSCGGTKNVDECESVLLFAAVVVHPSLRATDVLVAPLWLCGVLALCALVCPAESIYETEQVRDGRSRCLHEVN